MKVPVLSPRQWLDSGAGRRRFSLPGLTDEQLSRLGETLGLPLAGLTAQSGVDAIVAEVARDGDAAVRRLTFAFDGADLDSLELGRAEWEAGADRATIAEMAAIDAAADRIRRFHAHQVPVEIDLGELTLRPEPLGRVGIYVPGGRARYPSTVLMNAIPARLAGVGEILMATPPDAAGEISATVLYAARAAGVDRILRVGGAQAVAAMAHGTETIPAVDKITGPGNVFVTLAKRSVFGLVDIDGLAGPSEILVIADRSADPAQIVADLASQLEHDPQAWAVLLTPERDLAERVAADLAADPMANRFGAEAEELHAAAVVVGDLAEAVELAAAFAPEHLQLLVADPALLLPGVRCAGMVFCGPYSPVPMGDYVAGSNHTLPTGGAARFASPLGVYDFYRWTSVVSLGVATAAAIAPIGIELAKMEGLVAHRRSLEVLQQRIGRAAAPAKE